jgi:hypothetical protein
MTKINPLYCSYHQTTKDRGEPRWAETSRFSRAVDLAVTNRDNKSHNESVDVTEKLPIPGST